MRTRSRRAARTEWDGSITVLSDRFDGKPLNSANDVIVAGGNCIWFKDHLYGIMTDQVCFRARQKLLCQTYRSDLNGTVEAVIRNMACPNGLALSPGEKPALRCRHQPDPQHIRAYERANLRSENGRLFHKIG